jgi:hypothetical protein
LPKKPASALSALAALCVTLTGLAGTAQPDDPYVNLRAALIARGDADSLATAALMTPKDQAGQRDTLLSRAAAAAPQRADLAFLELTGCVHIPSCEVKPLEAKLRTLDKDNGAAWAGSVARADAGSTELKVKLAEIADAKRFDFYWNSLTLHLASAIERSGQADVGTSVVDAVGLLAAQGMPAFEKIANACKGGALQDPGMLAICRKLSVVLRHGDSIIAQMVGAGIAMRAWPDGSAEYQEAAAARRRAHYLIEEQSKLPPLEGTQNSPERYLRMLAQYRTEPEVMAARLREAGVDVNPPDGYP